jgi:DNA helicase-2/ATP-dependent DNA helicase PcrA
MLGQKENTSSIYEKLNEKQRLAATELDGAMLVIAGPGTGKTQIISARIASILSNTDTKPSQVLCLTYTDAGAVAMRMRLLQFIGPSAYQVRIQTFHAFCNTVIQENLSYFGIRGLSAVSELETIELIHQVIDGFKKDNPLKRYGGDIYYETNNLLSLYQLMKKESWSANFLHTKIDEYLQSLPHRDEYTYKVSRGKYKKGDLKQDALDAEQDRMKRLKAAADSFAVFQELMRKNNRYDFADMILWVIDAFKKDLTLLRNYQEQYLYFLVDEFQDTSGSQNEILNLLISYWHNPNIFCVGDDDQSIYRFQGASVDNIHRFIKTYEPKTITLTNNYRSTEQILAAAESLISLNKNRIDASKHLEANPRSHTTLLPEVMSFQNLFHEAAGICERIETLLSQGVAPGEIAVLYRNHKNADDIIQYLTSRNIPFSIRRKKNILHEPLIRQLVNLLSYLSKELSKPHSGESLLFEILHYDFWNINTLELAGIAIDITKNKNGISWREKLRQAENSKNKPDLFSSEEKKSVVNASVLIEKWIKNSVNLSLQQLIEQVINDSGILYKALTTDTHKNNLTLLHSFFDFVKSECEKNPKLTLKKLIETIDLMENEGLGIDTEEVLHTDDGIQLMTVHASKGLEFDYVFIIGCNTQNWEETRNRSPFKFPDNLFEITSEDADEEHRRLFYVGLTRARKHFAVSYVLKSMNGKDLEKSRFVAELESSNTCTSNQVHVSDALLVNFELALRKPKTLPPINDLFHFSGITPLLEKYTLSVTHLNNYLKCPTAFYFNNILRVPGPINPSMTFGSAVHYALERLFKDMNETEDKKFADADDFVKNFKWYMHLNESDFSESLFKLRIEYGSDFLPKYYQHYIDQWNKITSIERTYKNVLIDGVPINGKLDKLEFDGIDVNVVDYKTGQYTNALKKLNAPKTPAELQEINGKGKEPSHEDLLGGDYWRQAVFYKLLIKHDTSKNWKFKSVEFDFVEPDKKTSEFYKHKLTLTSSDEEVVSKQIVDTYQQIIAKQFDKGCNKEDCFWCNFANTYYEFPKKSSGLALSPVKEDDE